MRLIGKCPFIQGLHSKTAKYGIKSGEPVSPIFLWKRQPNQVRDVEGGVGIVWHLRNNRGRWVVILLVPIFHQFPSCRLYLNKIFTYLGTILKNQTDISTEMQAIRKREENQQNTNCGFCRNYHLAPCSKEDKGRDPIVFYVSDKTKADDDPKICCHSSMQFQEERVPLAAFPWTLVGINLGSI